jgi:hypothetical protein
MHTFYIRLFSTFRPEESYLTGLSRLTQATPEQMESLKGAVSWDEWVARTS